MLAAPVTAEESRSSFSTDIDGSAKSETVINRTANRQPTSVTETGAGINGNDSLTDAAGGISTVINKGAQAAQEDLAKANKEINDLKSAIANVGPAGSDMEFKDSYGYNVKSSCNSTWDKSGRCRSRIYYYKRCKKTQTIQDGQVVKTDYYSASNWSNGRYRSGSIYSGPKMIC
jgi:hypothetical protein